MKPSITTRGILNRFLVEDFYTPSETEKRLVKAKKTSFEDFVIINIVLPHHSTFNNLLLRLISLYKDLR